jgi:hypothetical protein
MRDQPKHLFRNLRHQPNGLHFDLCVPAGLLLHDMRHQPGVLPEHID